MIESLTHFLTQFQDYFILAALFRTPNLLVFSGLFYGAVVLLPIQMLVIVKFSIVVYLVFVI